MDEKIRVQMTKKKSAFGYEYHIYHPGDIFEIESSLFREDFMVKVEEPQTKPVKETEVVKPVQNVVRRKTWKLPEEP